MKAFIVDHEGEWRDGISIVVAEDEDTARALIDAHLRKTHPWLIKKYKRLANGGNMVTCIEEINLDKEGVQNVYMGED